MADEAERGTTVESAENEGRRLKRRLLAPLFGIIAVFSVVAIGMLGSAAVRLNDDSIRDEAHRLERALERARTHATNLILDYAYWNDSAEQGVKARDTEWADANFSWLTGHFGFSGVYILAEDGSQIYGRTGAGRDGGSVLERFGRPLAEIVTETRASPMERPIPASTFASLGGTAFLLVACAISPEDPTGDLLLPHPRPVLVGVRAFDAAALRELSEDLLLPGLAVVFEEGGGLRPTLPLRGEASGVVPAWLTWEPARVAYSLLSVLAATVFATLLVCAVLSVLLYREILLVAGRASDSLRRAAAARAELARSEEGQRVARLHAEEASRAKSIFLANASRDLRTPLNAIIGLSEIILMKAAGGITPDELTNRVTAIRDSGIALLQKINDLIDLSRAEVGRQNIDPERLAVAHILDRARRRLSTITEPRDIQIDLSCDDAVTMWADPLAFERLSTALMTNAVSCSLQGGRVQVDARELANGAGRLIVRDFGPGLDPRVLPHVFQPFSAAPDTGLGLAIVKALVDLHGGRISVDSEPGSGTTVCVTFPPPPLQHDGHESHSAAPAAV